MKKYFGLLFILIAIFLVNAVEAKSLTKGEVYSYNGERIEVISSSELEITEGGKTFVADYEFKGDKLRVIANVMGTKMVQYYSLTNEGLIDEKSRQVYYSKAGLSAPKIRSVQENFEAATQYVQAEIAKRNIDITKVTTNAVADLNRGNKKTAFDNTISAFVEGNNVKAGQVAISAANIKGLSAGSTVTIKADVDGDGKADKNVTLTVNK